MEKWIEIALKMAEKSSHGQHKMSCLLIKGGNVVSAACNLGRRHRCAEARAIRPNRDWTGCTALVVRSNLGCSKPCSDCMDKIRKSGIDRVVYFNSNGKIEKMKITE